MSCRGECIVSLSVLSCHVNVLCRGQCVMSAVVSVLCRDQSVVSSHGQCVMRWSVCHIRRVQWCVVVSV